VDLIFVVDDVANWNKENYYKNKKHYPLISKIFTYRLVNFFQTRGAKIHYNYYTENNDV
jgi:hypothetical protein